MRKVYMSFLGLGDPTKDDQGKIKGYKSARYELNGQVSHETKYIQVAEMELLRGSVFDLVLIVATKKSYEVHFTPLQQQMELHGARPASLILEEDFSPQGQWTWFESILSSFKPNDLLTVDLTHGYRAIPIIFSTAINFLQKARNIQLFAVYYGAFVTKDQVAPIVDMKDFYVVNEWAEAVSRLVEDADARNLAQVAEKSSGFHVGELNDPELVKALDELTNAVRNVDVNTVAEKANKALSLVQQNRKTASATGRLLLDLVLDKFKTLTMEVPVSGYYDSDYYRVQLAIAKLLHEHRLYMQTFTVLREFIGSLAMVFRQKQRMTNADGRKCRLMYGEIFIQMIQWPKDEWKFDQKKQELVYKLLPLYKELDHLGVVDRLRSFMKDLSDFRNGFDHAWTSRIADFNGMQSRVNLILAELEKVFDLIVEEGLLQRQILSR